MCEFWKVWLSNDVRAEDVPKEIWIQLSQRLS
jgi:hypothetical protein